MGHANPRIFDKRYASKLSSIDIQGLLLNNETQEDWSVAKFRRETVGPRPALSLSFEKQRYIHAEMQKISEPSNSPEYKRAYANLHIAAWKEVRQNKSNRSRLDEKPVAERSPSFESMIPNSVEKLGDLRTMETRSRILFRYDGDRQKAATACLAQESALRHPGSLLDSLIAMSDLRKSAYELYYPNEQPQRVMRNNRVFDLLCKHCNTSLYK